MNGLSADNKVVKYHTGTDKEDADIVAANNTEGDNIGGEKPCSDSLIQSEGDGPPKTNARIHAVQIWTEIRPSLLPIEDMMSFRVRKTADSMKSEQDVQIGKQLPPIEEARPAKGASEEDSEEEFYDLERSESDILQDVPPADGASVLGTGGGGSGISPESLPPWREELEILVQGGLPMALRGEVC